MQKAYRTIRKQGKINEQELASLLVKNGQGLLAIEVVPVVRTYASSQVHG